MANHNVNHLPCTSGYRKKSEKSQHNLQGDNVVLGQDKKQYAFFSSVSSVQNLGFLDDEKERKDDSSTTRVLGACKKILEPDTRTPKNITQSGVHSSDSRTLSHWTSFFKIWKKRSIKPLASFPLVVPKISRKSKSRENVSSALSELYNFKSTLKDFTLSELRRATNNFRHDNLIGSGGFAEVFKGCLPNGQLIAIKRLKKGTSDEKIAGFLSEFGIVAHLNHLNISKLIGSGIEGGMHLVFQYSPLGSLGSLLHGSKDKLDWSKRYKIALGIADGLLYLHEISRRRIIHRDIKSDNILLTEDFEPQISDFGLAKWLPSQWTHRKVPKFEGTLGYIAPEYFMRGIVNEKTDVYAFGVLLLEIIRGQRVFDHLQKNLVIWAKPLLDNNDIRELVDPDLGDNYDMEEMNRVVLTASLCIEHSPILRPQMSQVVVLLRGDEYAEECTKERQTKSFQRTCSQELLDAQEYNSAKHLHSLN